MDKNIKDGDLIQITTSDETIQGTLMPNSDKNKVILKLNNGYNLIVKKEKIKDIKQIKKFSQEKTAKNELPENKKLPTISILHTGGTIASKVDYKTGGVYASFTAGDLIEMVPEIKDLANIRSNLISNMMSEDMLFIHYKKIADAIIEEIKKGSKGIVIGHGTDTLAITSAALSFMLENLPVPVIVVGSQRSSDRGSSDAAMNLLCAVEFMTKTDFKGVAICMHENSEDENCLILSATKTRKMHTSRRDAFRPVNSKPIARINYKTRKIEFINYHPHAHEGKLILKNNFEEKVGIIRTHPNMHREVFEVFRKNKYKGLILESSGIGQAPTNIKENLPIYEELKKFIDSGGIIILTSQCIFGRVHPDIYANCRRLKDIGIIFGEDMLTETAFVKLSWLLGNYKNKKEIEELITKNLRGEINPRIMPDEFLNDDLN